MKKTVISLTLSCCLALSLCTTSFASETEVIPPEDSPACSSEYLDSNENSSVNEVLEASVSEDLPQAPNAEPRAPGVPSSHKNLGTSSAYEATLIDLAATKSSYTRYYFSTPTGKIYLNADLRASGTSTSLDRVLTIELRDLQDDSLIETRTIEFNDRISAPGSRRIFNGLDTDGFYYIKFKNSSGTSTYDRLDISGTILIDDVLV